jgi:hypothetical protein
VYGDIVYHRCRFAVSIRLMHCILAAALAVPKNPAEMLPQNINENACFSVTL